ncbi:MAG: SocA family protein [Rhodospirillaceae bacterium]|nr:SocA family protein [Rhodospirillales bacterium]
MNARHVADYILSKIDVEAGDSITNLKLQKLLYYVQGWHLAVNGGGLFEDDVQAWPYGPVVPEIYHAFKMFGSGAILPTSDLKAAEGQLPETTRRLIDQVWERYGAMTGLELMRKTHKEAPWLNTPEGRSITPETMRDFFVQERQRLIASSGLGEPDDDTVRHIEEMLSAHA